MLKSSNGHYVHVAMQVSSLTVCSCKTEKKFNFNGSYVIDSLHTACPTISGDLHSHNEIQLVVMMDCSAANFSSCGSNAKNAVNVDWVASSAFAEKVMYNVFFASRCRSASPRSLKYLGESICGVMRMGQ